MITGVPGMGKTALLVQMLLELEKQAERPLFVMGVTGLTLEHTPCPPVEEWTEKRADKDDPSLLLDYYLFPPNSILVVDEAQRVFRTRSAGSKVPPHVSALETHRHTGLDIILLTQKPLLIDSNVRELTGRHIHIRNNLLGMRYLYEWFEFQDVNNKANLSEAIKRKYSPPKEVFQYYKSAEVHTKPPRRVHQVFYILLAAILFTGWYGYSVYTRIFSKNHGVDAVIENRTTPQITPLSIDLTDLKKTQLQNINVSEAPPQEAKHPFIGYQFIIKGTIHSKRLNRTYYQLENGNRSVFTNDTELKKLGYIITENNDCSAFLTFEGAFVAATCEAVNDPVHAPRAGGGAVTAEHYPTPRPLIDSSDYQPSAI
jgi:zona occludens toxin (predicted ATPase)